jgi:hypothetical protein
MLSSVSQESVEDRVIDPKIAAEVGMKRSLIHTRKLSLGGRQLQEYDKLFIAMQYRERFKATGLSQNQFAEQIGLSQRTLAKYLNALDSYSDNDVMVLHSRSGRPCKLDQQGIDDVLGLIKATVRAQHAPDKEAVKQMIIRSANDTKRRRGEESFETQVSKTYFHTFAEEHGLVEAKVQLKTDARIEAEADPRNAYSMICLVKAYCEGLDPNLILNWDATQYVVSDDLQRKGIYIKAEKPNSGPLTAPSHGGLAFAIKMYHLHNASGYSAPPVFVIADESLSEDAFFFSKVIGLGLSGEMTTHGWVCVTKTRACNAAFYRWFGKEVVCSFVRTSRENVLISDDETPTHAFVSCDGEAKQIEVFQEDDMLQSLDEHDIILVKTPASCSAICQPSDVSSFFKASKKRLEYIPRSLRTGSWKIDGVELPVGEEDQMEAAITKMIQNKFTRSKILDALNCTGYCADKKDKVVTALQRILWAIRDTLRMSVVAQGYIDIGWGPRPSLSHAMSKCTATIPAKISKTLHEKFEAMAAIYRNSGTLTEKDMDDAGIVSINHLYKRKKLKDQRVLHQQRAVVMNSPACIAQYREHKDAKEKEKADKEERQQAFHTYKMGLQVYQRWVASLAPEQQQEESKVLKKGKKARVNSLLTQWQLLGAEACPWLLEPPN